MKLASGFTKKLEGTIIVPGSKSHTIRAAVIAMLADGDSTIRNALNSGDGLSALSAIKAAGARVEEKDTEWKVHGLGGKPKFKASKIDVGNSGTTLRFMASMAAIQEKEITFDGDGSLRTRQMGPLLKSLEILGAKTKSMNGFAPLSVKGPITPGSTSVSGKTSQYISSLLLACPLLEGDTKITIYDQLNEQPYVDVTLEWLDEQGIRYKREGIKNFTVYGKQSYKSFSKMIPGDWSSAAFPLCAAAITGSEITVSGVDINDSQGDKEIIEILKKMGCKINISGMDVSIKAGNLKGREIDLNSTPDLLPILSIVGCFASGKTVLKNVPQARIKETDRIAVMCSELKKMGASITELEDGLLIERSSLHGANVDGYKDHRVIMSLACAGMCASGITEIKDAEHISVTFPYFVEKMKKIGANFNEN
ncbi:3-phosphoshikimate 1-carboxyvinyltransferase [Candidatus Woesearchaeota archaeon]|nr:3-phosphoshikimate 1-carboxyvinyltransferase [Candidatus Woesearchaeota archaeon]